MYKDICKFNVTKSPFCYAISRVRTQAKIHVLIVPSKITVSCYIPTMKLGENTDTIKISLMGENDPLERTRIYTPPPPLPAEEDCDHSLSNLSLRGRVSMTALERSEEYDSQSRDLSHAGEWGTTTPGPW